MECGRRIYTRRQWTDFCREWNEEKKNKKKKRNLSQNRKSGNRSSVKEVIELSDDSESEITETIAEEKPWVSEGKEELESDSAADDHCFSSFEEPKKNKKRKRKRNAGCEKKKNGDDTQLSFESFDPHLESTEKVVMEDGIDEDEDNKNILSGAVNVSTKDEYEDCDETFTVRQEEFAPQSPISEESGEQMQKSSKKQKEKVIAADNLSSDSSEDYGHGEKELGYESHSSLLNEKNSYDDDKDYEVFLEDYLAFLAGRGEMAVMELERSDGEDDKNRGSSEKNEYDDYTGFWNKSVALSSEKKEKMDKSTGNISPKADDEKDNVKWITGSELVPHSDLQEKADKQMDNIKKERKKINSSSDVEDYDEDKDLVDESKGEVAEKRQFDDNKKLGFLKNKCSIKDGKNHEGPAYRLRSSPAYKCEKEKKLGNVRQLLPASEDLKFEVSSDEASNEGNRMRSNVHKINLKVDHPIKERKPKYEQGDLNLKNILISSILDVTNKNMHLCEENIPKPLPLKFRFEDEDLVPPQKSEWEKEIEGLFENLQLDLEGLKDSLTTQSLDNGNNISAENHDDSAVCCQKGEHLLILDEEIGLMCKYCSFVHQERKYIFPSFVDKSSVQRGLRFFDKLDNLSTDNLPFGGTAGHHFTSIDGGGTVWDVLPQRTKDTMYPHQREGFEFMWRNIAGDIHIKNLKNLQSDDGNGCIISHAPGTGKTRTTIVFLQSFMKLFPTCCPIIIAPRVMLLAWEGEFRKWEVDIPFHNFNNPMLSGRDNIRALGFSSEPKSVHLKRKIKLARWAQGSGVLGITYRLFEQLVRVKESKDDGFREALLRVPKLVVLDEGHTPRNDDSLIWKALTKIETKRRIILSGTPFQNNFDELYNTLCLVSPNFSGFASGSQPKCVRKRKAAKKRWDRLTNSIEEVKSFIAPLVHLYKGHILLERLPGLRSTLVYLKPTTLQQKLFSVIPQKKVLEEDYIMTRISVHPSLVKDLSNFSAYRSEVEGIELHPDAGVKTEFLFALIRLCDTLGEKVIVFSQFIAPIDLIKNQLKSMFGWVEGREVLLMDGDIDVQRRQASINTLNDPKSEVKVLLASTRACCEGINLVGASRVVFLDACWNPSVKRQAVSRAYRLGQTRIVHAYQLISSTFEAKKYAQQAKKDIISELIFSTSDGLPCNRDLPVSEDGILEAMVKHPKHRLIFDRLVHDPKASDLFDTYDYVE